MIKLEIHTMTLDDYHKELAGIAGSAGVTSFSTEDLLLEVRKRMSAKNLIVNIDPISTGVELDPEGNVSDTAATVSETPLSKDTRKQRGPKPRAGNVEPEKGAAVQNSTPSEEKTSQSEQNSSHPLDAASTSAPSAGATTATRQLAVGEAPVSRDDVISALNVYAAARGGQVAGRKIMSDTCGTTRLMDVKPEDYPRLVRALEHDAVAA